MNIAKRSAITRARTEPIQIGYHPKKVNNTVENSAGNDRVISGLLPLVAIRTTSIKKMLNIKEIIIPASVNVTPIALAIPVRYSAQITILIKEGRGG